VTYVNRHVMRMEDAEVLKRIILYRPEGERE
jgi:hypothetical protein